MHPNQELWALKTSRILKFVNSPIRLDCLFQGLFFLENPTVFGEKKLPKTYFSQKKPVPRWIFFRKYLFSKKHIFIQKKLPILVAAKQVGFSDANNLQQKYETIPSLEHVWASKKFLSSFSNFARFPERSLFIFDVILVPIGPTPRLKAQPCRSERMFPPIAQGERVLIRRLPPFE